MSWENPSYQDLLYNIQEWTNRPVEHNKDCRKRPTHIYENSEYDKGGIKNVDEKGCYNKS